MRNTSRTDEDNLGNAEERYCATKREASLQFEPAEFQWKEALQRDPNKTLENWIDRYGYDYLDAYEKRAWAKQNLKRAQQTGSRDVLRQKDLMESAPNSHDELPGNNMPCAMHDVSVKTLANKDPTPKDVVHRPLQFARPSQLFLFYYLLYSMATTHLHISIDTTGMSQQVASICEARFWRADSVIFTDSYSLTKFLDLGSAKPESPVGGRMGLKH